MLLGGETLEHDDCRHQRETGYVGEGAGDHHTETAHRQNQTEQRVDAAVEEAVQRGGDGEDAQD